MKKNYLTALFTRGPYTGALSTLAIGVYASDLIAVSLVKYDVSRSADAIDDTHA